MPLIYRAMLADGDKPLVGSSNKSLGVRFPPDKHSDIPVEPGGTVQPGTGGLSVAPSWRELPSFLIPRRLRTLNRNAAGSNLLRSWCMGEGPFVDGPVSDRISLRVDPKNSRHGFLEPSVQIAKEEFQAAIAATREFWHVDEA
jgi:hypothetical protein